jgi:hypothetical protein
MATRKEILEALKDPALLKEAGLAPISDKEEDELFADITLGENDSMADMLNKINDRSRKQRAYLKDREAKILKAAAKAAEEPEKTRKQKEVDSFLEKHPELSNNKKLLDKVKPLYDSGMSLTEAYKDGCKLLDLDPATGLVPKEGEEKKEGDDKGEKKGAKEKRTAMKSDSSVDTGLPDYQYNKNKKDDDDKPKTTREILSEQANEMAANGTNPWRTAP